MKNTFHANRDLKKAGIVIKTSVKIDFKTKTVIRDQKKKRLLPKKSLQMIKVLVKQEDITL